MPALLRGRALRPVAVALYWLVACRCPLADLGICRAKASQGHRNGSLPPRALRSRRAQAARARRARACVGGDAAGDGRRTTRLWRTVHAVSGRRGHADRPVACGVAPEIGDPPRAHAATRALVRSPRQAARVPGRRPRGGKSDRMCRSSWRVTRCSGDFDQTLLYVFGRVASTALEHVSLTVALRSVLLLFVAESASKPAPGAMNANRERPGAAPHHAGCVAMLEAVPRHEHQGFAVACAQARLCLQKPRIALGEILSGMSGRSVRRRSCRASLRAPARS
jgi:hypothetical protein